VQRLFVEKQAVSFDAAFEQSTPLLPQALVAQRIEHLTSDQKVGGSSPSKRTFRSIPLIFRGA